MWWENSVQVVTVNQLRRIGNDGVENEKYTTRCKSSNSMLGIKGQTLSTTVPCLLSVNGAVLCTQPFCTRKHLLSIWYIYNVLWYRPQRPLGQSHRCGWHFLFGFLVFATRCVAHIDVSDSVKEWLIRETLWYTGKKNKRETPKSIRTSG